MDGAAIDGRSRRLSAANRRSTLHFCGSRALAAILRLPSDVHCRIKVLDEDEIRVVRVAGRLADAQVPDLLIACSEAPGTVRVDLTELSSADAIAIEALSRLRDGGVELLSVPRYLQITLDGLAHKPRKR